MKQIFYVLRVIGFFTLFWGPALAGLQPPEMQQFLEEQWVRCGEFDLTVWGKDQDLRLTRGEDGILQVASSTVTLICGKKKLEVFCDLRTKVVWVKRTSDRDAVVVCYKQK